MESRSQIRSRHHPAALGNRSGGRCGALGRLEGAHADYFEHLYTMILLDAPGAGRGAHLGVLPRLWYHLVKASEKQLANGLIERDFARLRCPKMSHFEFCPRRRVKAASSSWEAILLREKCGTAALSAEKDPACYRGATKSSKAAARMRGILARQQPIIGCRLLKASGFWTLAARQGAGTSPPSLAPPRA